MDVSTEGTVDTESCNELEDEKPPTEGQMLPAYMTAIMRRQFLQEMVKSLPPPMQNRITALKNIQLEHLKLESEFYQEVYKLEKQYQQKYQPLFDRRKQIITGENEPQQQKPEWNAETEQKNSEEIHDFTEALKPYKSLSESTKGIPDFWFTIFRNTEILSEMVQEHDEPVLKKLTDITIKYDDEHSYTLEFHFDKNEYFSNPILTKKYFLKASIDEEYPFAFEGPEIYKCKGCIINWEKKMNLTVKTIRKKQKHKERGAVRTIVKQVPTDSFFNFFDPPEIPEDQDEIDEESQGILATDFEIGHFLRARIIPKAVLYFTGDIVDDEDDDDEYDEGEDDDDDSGDEIEAYPKNTGNKKKPSPNECQNQ